MRIKFFAAAAIVSAVFLLKPVNVAAYSVEITGNGEGSTNTSNLNVENQEYITSTNEANVANLVDANSNTGNNSANSNNGDVAIETGDARAEVSIDNNLNNALVNTGCCSSDTNVQISGNGSSSTNVVNLSLSNQIFSSQNNIFNVGNNVFADPNTGGNIANNNNGRVRIKTGDASVVVTIKNSGNQNISVVGGPKEKPPTIQPPITPPTPTAVITSAPVTPTSAPVSVPAVLAAAAGKLPVTGSRFGLLEIIAISSLMVSTGVYLRRRAEQLA